MRQVWIAVTMVLAVATSAAAQAPTRPPAGGGLGGGIGGSPATSGFSPYLNISRGGGSAAVNYYGIVRPQLSLQASVQSLQQQQTALTGGQDDGSVPGLVTGTRARFLNTGGYFLNLNGGTTPAVRSGFGAQSGTGTASSGSAAGSSLRGTFGGSGAGTFGSSGGGRGGLRGPRN